jgi:hypothetical protein
MITFNDAIMSKNSQGQPNWQPISRLPLIAQMIEQGLSDALTQYQNLQEAQNRPHVLDDYTVGRVIQVFGEEQQFLLIYSEQIALWKQENLNATQRKEIVKLEEQLDLLSTTVASILALADELKHKTIEKVLGKSDLEIGLDVLLGNLKF